jgi:hypothetical protein
MIIPLVERSSTVAANAAPALNRENGTHQGLLGVCRFADVRVLAGLADEVVPNDDLVAARTNTDC